MQNALWLTQSVVSHQFEISPRLWFVTKNATWVGGEAELNLLSSPIWGFGAAVFMEHPELCCKRVDVDSEVSFFPLLFCDEHYMVKRN
jgi:hypothetical protein